MFGVDFSETFTPVARLDTIRMLLALTAHKSWVVYDVKSTFLMDTWRKKFLLSKIKDFFSRDKKRRYID